MKIKDYEKLKTGDRIVFSKKYVQLFWDEAWEMNRVKGGLTNEVEADGYFMWRAIGAGFPYTLTFIRHEADVGEGPGALVEYVVAGLSRTCYLAIKDMNLLKEKTDVAA